MSVDHTTLDTDARLSSKTLEMFVNTCDYMKFLIDEILASDMIIPEKTVFASNELTSKLLILMNKLYQQIPLKTQNCHNLVNVKKEEAPGNSKPSLVESNNPVSQNVDNFSDITAKKPVLKDSNNVKKLQCSIETNCENSLAAKKPVLKDSNNVNKVQCSSEINRENSLVKEVPVDGKKSYQGDTENSIYVTENFSWVNKEFLNHKSTDYSFFCVSCDKRLIVNENDDLWSKHISEETHLASINKVLGKIVFISCEQCKFILFGGKAKTLKFYKFHNLNVHGELNSSVPENKNNFQEEYCIQPPKNLSRSSSKSSVSKEGGLTSTHQVTKTLPPNQEDSCKPPSLDLSRSSSISSMGKETISVAPVSDVKVAQNLSHHQPDYTLSQGLSSSVSSIASSSSSVAVPGNSVAKPRNKKKKVKPVTSVNENYNTSTQQPIVEALNSQQIGETVSTGQNFSDIIDGIKRSVYTYGVKLNSGYCIPCNKGFESAFAWYDHMVSNHERPNKMEKEIACEKCDLKLFGKEIDIENIYLNCSSHVELDALVEELIKN